MKKTFTPRYFFEATIWTLLFLAFTEVFLRVFFMSIPSENQIRQGGGVEIRGYEGYGIMRYLPNAEIASARDDGTKNIVVLGDSYTHAPHVMFWESYVSIAENALYAHGKTDFNLRNFGRRKQNLANYLGVSPSLIEVYKPKAIVIQLNFKDILYDGFGRKNAFYFQEESNGEIALKKGETYKNLSVVAPVDNSTWSLFSTFDFSVSSIQHVVEFQRTNLFPDKANPNANANSEDAAQDVSANSEDGAQRLIRYNKNGLDEFHLSRIKKIIALMESTYKDIPVIFVFIPQAGKEFYYKNDNKSLLQLISLLEERPNWSVVYPFDEFSQSVLQGDAPQGFGNTVPMEGHINVIGHRLVGEALANHLLNLSLCEK